MATNNKIPIILEPEPDGKRLSAKPKKEHLYDEYEDPFDSKFVEIFGNDYFIDLDN